MPINLVNLNISTKLSDVVSKTQNVMRSANIPVLNVSLSGAISDALQKVILLVGDVTKLNNPNFEKFSKNYINTEPELLLAVDYVVDDRNVGVLLVWERFFDSTHYEIFKKNTFQTDAVFERILFLDSTSLEEETRHYMDYLKNTVGFDIREDNVFVVLDTLVKEDRIYEYKMKASRVPKNAFEVDYDFILESKSLTKQLIVDQNNTSTVFDFAGASLGSKDLAWIIALMNDKVVLCGKGPLETSLVSLSLERNEDNEEFVTVASDLLNVIKVFNESTSLFGLKSSLEHILRSIGGISADVREVFLASVDETRNVFSYDNFRTELVKTSPAYSLSLKVAESNSSDAILELSKLSIIVPRNTGNESIASLNNLTKIIKFVNDNIVALLYSQDSSEKVQEILKNISISAVQQDNVAPLTVGIESTTATNPTVLTNQGSSAILADGAPSTSVNTAFVAAKPMVRII